MKDGPEATVVTLFLVGDDPPTWKTSYDAAWADAYDHMAGDEKLPGMEARAVDDMPPWSIRVVLPAGMGWQAGLKVLELAGRGIQQANKKESDRQTAQRTGVAAFQVEEWWRSSLW